MSAALVQVGLDRSKAPVAVLGEAHRRVQVGHADLDCAGRRVVPLVTCHRVEAYFEGVPPPVAVEEYLAWIGVSPDQRADLLPMVAVRVGDAAARHLFRIAAGLESAVLGEDQILGQVRAAYRGACSRGSAGPLLHRLFHAAFRAGKRVRSETNLGGGGRSLAGSGVGLLCRVLDPLSERCVLVLGVGEMGSIAARRLSQRGVGRLLIANRTFDAAVALAAEVGGEALPWDWRQRVLCEVDGVVSATSARSAVIESAWIAAAAAPRGRLRCAVDLAVPADIEVPHPCPAGLVAVDVDAIGSHLADDDRQRRNAILDAGAIVEEEVLEWLAQIGRGEAWRSRRAGSVRKNLAG